jgi:Fe-S cluster assembly iron-binding protein IscA
VIALFRSVALEVDRRLTAEFMPSERSPRMLTLTARAATAVSSVLSSPDVPAGSTLRLQHGIDSDGEATIGIAVVSEPQPDDEPVPEVDGELYLAPEVAAVLDDHILDAEVQDESLAFTIRRRSNNGDLFS